MQNRPDFLCVVKVQNKVHFCTSKDQSKTILRPLLLLVVFSACGGKPTGIIMQFFQPAFPFNGLGHLGKGWIVRGTTTQRLPYLANGLFYPSWNRLYRFTTYRQQCGRLPGTDLASVLNGYSTNENRVK